MTAASPFRLSDCGKRTRPECIQALRTAVSVRARARSRSFTLLTFAMENPVENEPELREKGRKNDVKSGLPSVRASSLLAAHCASDLRLGAVRAAESIPGEAAIRNR